ncbi:hypothetical protein EYF80_064541 [Liparis tanakae]|uniref:Uncharacterized protein n=1 Tax=Liparis tanakae TaxID=230148 RepID=A0A4Z2E9U3_9TELE|nr:hypothetical protein EYF80_064541 [Liparis tanakae]
MPLTPPTHQRLPGPVVLVVEDVPVPVEQVGEQLPQVVVVRLLEEVQAAHVAQGMCFLVSGSMYSLARPKSMMWMVCCRLEPGRPTRKFSGFTSR